MNKLDLRISDKRPNLELSVDNDSHGHGRKPMAAAHIIIINSVFLIFVAFTLCHAGKAVAQDSSNYGLLGDWGGMRTKLDDAGLNFQLGYALEGAYNPAGGLRNEVDEAGQLALGATANLDKLFGDSDAKFQLTLTHRDGRDLNQDSGIGALQDLQEVYGRGDIWRIAQLFYDQIFFRNTLDIKLGKFAEGEDFAAFACDFQNLSFCGSAPGNIEGDYWYKPPVSQWGARFKFLFEHQGYVQTAVYEINPLDTKNSEGFNLSPSGGVGALIPLEGAWTPTLWEQHLPGIYNGRGMVCDVKSARCLREP